MPDSQSFDADYPLDQLREALDVRLGSPGKWELLFQRDGRLIQGTVERIDAQPSYRNPTLEDASKPRSAFVPYEATIPAVHDWSVLDAFRESNLWDRLPRFALAGERTHYALDPTRLTAGIIVAGGPAAGLNMVVDSIVKRHFSLATLSVGHQRTHQVRVAGYLGGYVGLRNKDRVWLAPSQSSLKQASYGPGESVIFTDEWATEPGIRIKTLREKSETNAVARQRLAAELAEILHQEALDILYVIGGNGTLSWASEVSGAFSTPSGHRLVVVGGPKTMDNDVNFTDVTFGFRTSVDNSAEFIRNVHTGAEAMNRLGVIELFGAASGFVALHAAYVSGVADCVMIPEPPYSDEEKVVTQLDKRLAKNGHAVLVVAEGALAEFQHGNNEQKEEAFNNFLRRLRARFGALVDVRARYLMRDTRPNAFDLELCKWSGKLMVDTALAGFTRCSVNLWQGDYVLVPMTTATASLKQIAPWSYYLQTLLDRERLALLGSGLEASTAELYYG